MPHELHIPSCIHKPAHPFHPPPLDKPLRIQIVGPLVSIERLLPAAVWNHDVWNNEFPQTAGPVLAQLTYYKLYGQKPRSDFPADLVIRDEYLGLCGRPPNPVTHFDYYSITFDHLVPADDADPEVLQINIIELEAVESVYADGLKYAKETLWLEVELVDYVGKRILAVPRCCTKRRGTTDRRRVNGCVAERDERAREMLEQAKEELFPRCRWRYFE